MIIRVNASLQLGGQYLEHVYGGSRIECVHLCCETAGCDVFVYWEHENNTCFLFRCGSPTSGDFRCAFTAHEGYTSAVLRPQPTPPAQVPELAQRASGSRPTAPRTPQEMELSSLMAQKPAKATL